MSKPSSAHGPSRYCTGKLSSSGFHVSFCGDLKRMMYTIAEEQPMKTTFRNELYIDEKFQKRSR